MIRQVIGLVVVSLFANTPLQAADKTVKVFILAGQSNMEGKARNTLLDYQATDAKTKDLFADLRKDVKWVVRDDVFIKFLDRTGPLTVGYGSPSCTKNVQDNYATLFPELQGKTLELAGFVWFQGFNDIFGAQDEYASNMQHFIKDVRQDLGTPNLPFVIGALGQNGSKPATGGMLTVREAQLSMNEVPEFKGNVKAFPVDVLVDKAAEAMFPNWQKEPEWVHTGSDRPYHYYGSAIWFNRIGKAMGDAMLELLKNPK